MRLDGKLQSMFGEHRTCESDCLSKRVEYQWNGLNCAHHGIAKTECNGDCPALSRETRLARAHMIRGVEVSRKVKHNEDWRRIRHLRSWKQAMNNIVDAAFRIVDAHHSIMMTSCHGT